MWWENKNDDFTFLFGAISLGLLAFYFLLVIIVCTFKYVKNIILAAVVLGLGLALASHYQLIDHQALREARDYLQTAMAR